MTEGGLYERQLSNLDHDLSPIMEELLDPKVTDIMVNPGGNLWVKKFGLPTAFSGRVIGREAILRIIMSTAALIEKRVTKDQWNLTGVIPKYNARIEAFIEPTVTSPTFCLRKPTFLSLSLEDYVKDGRLSPTHRQAIVQSIKERANILIGGGTGTGKTTLLNAVIAEIARLRPDDRLYIVEDTPEINCKAPNFVSLAVAANESIKAVRSALRYKPDRIIFGELRYGEVALEWLKSSSTGHPGGLCTLHADSAQRMLPRMRDLLLECFSGSVPLNIIYEAIGLCVYLKDIPGFGPRVVEVAKVQPGLDAGGNFQYINY